MRPLMIDNTISEALKGLIDHARLHPFDMDDLLDIYNGAEKPASLRDGFTLIVPIDYKVTVTYEKQVKANLLHLSFSVPGGKLPNPMACQLILQEMGLPTLDKMYLIDYEREPGVINIYHEIK